MTDEVKEHVFSVSVGQYFDIPAPCCTWATFGASCVIVITAEGAPSHGDVDTFRLDRTQTERRLEPSEASSVTFGTINTNVAAGVNTRLERTFNSGVGGIRVRNGLDVPLSKVVVTWRPLTTHVIQRR